MAQHKCQKGWILMPNDEGDMVPFFVQVRDEDVHHLIDPVLAMKLQQDTGVAPVDCRLISGKVFVHVGDWDLELSNSMSSTSGGKAIAELHSFQRLGDLKNIYGFQRDSDPKHIFIDVPIPIPFFASNILCSINANAGIAADWNKCRISTQCVNGLYRVDNTVYLNLSDKKFRVHLYFDTNVTEQMIDVNNMNNCSVGLSMNVCGHYVPL